MVHQSFSGMRGPNFTKLGEGIGRSSQHCFFCFRVRISSCIFKRWRLIFKWRWKRRQISHILTPCEN